MSLEEVFFKQISFLVKPMRFEDFLTTNICELKIKHTEETKLKKGDYIKVLSKSKTIVCRIKKSSYEHEHNLIYLPYKLREKYNIQINEYIRIQPFPIKIAKYVKIIPVELDIKPTKKIIKLTKDKLLDKPLLKKDVISIDIGFFNELFFEVLEIQPTNPALISSNTVFIIESAYFKEMKIKGDMISRLMV